MPAYRSEAEAAIRGDVVARLREWRPEARIIHEVNVCQGGCRIDVLAVSPTEIIAVEIKSERDKLDRAPAQIAAMRGVAHHVMVVMHRKFLVEKEIGNRCVADFVRDGKPYRLQMPPEVLGAQAMVWPESARPRPAINGCWYAPQPPRRLALPSSAIDMLWRCELADLCARLGLKAPRRATRLDLINSIEWSASGEAVTKGICAALRARNVIEGDPPHDPHPNCESGKRPHCTCDTCF